MDQQLLALDIQFEEWMDKYGACFCIDRKQWPELHKWSHEQQKLLSIREHLLYYVMQVYRYYSPEKISVKAFDKIYRFSAEVQNIKSHSRQISATHQFLSDLKAKKGEIPVHFPFVWDFTDSEYYKNAAKGVRQENHLLCLELDGAIEKEYREIQAKVKDGQQSLKHSVSNIPDYIRMDGFDVSRGRADSDFYHVNRRLTIVISCEGLTRRNQKIFKFTPNVAIPSNLNTIGHSLVQAIHFDSSCATVTEIGHGFLSGGASAALHTIDFTNLVNVQRIGANFMRRDDDHRINLTSVRAIYLDKERQSLLYEAIPDCMKDLVVAPLIPLNSPKPAAKKEECVIC